MIGSCVLSFYIFYTAYRAKIVADKQWVEISPDEPINFCSEDVREEKQIVKSC